MEQIMEGLKNPELRKHLAELEAADDREQAAFDKLELDKHDRAVERQLATATNILTKPRHNPVLQQAIRRECGRGR
jgi:hypothetical protein